MGLYYKTEFVWGRDDDGNHRKRRVTSGSGMRKVSWRKWEPRYVKKEDDG